MQARLSSKGQLVIPKALRRELKLLPGAEFRIRVAKGKIILEVVEQSPISAMYGKYADADFLSELEREHKKEVDDDKSHRA